MNDLAAGLAALYARAPRGVRLGTEAMQQALDRAGNPERSFQAAHIAGTNGKGSVSAMLESALRHSGVRTGLYTSPHLHRFAERVRVDGAVLDDATLATHVHEALALGPVLSFFEVATLAAFLAFRAAGVQLAVVEVGLGGRFDATNVALAKRVTAITSIALDHQAFLGDTLEQIAGEKAGILRPGVPCVLGELPTPARQLITQEAARVGAPLLGPRRYQGTLRLAGAHQQHNAGVALAMSEVLGLDAVASARGIAEASWPGRCERLEGHDGPLLLDGAHNLEGAQALRQALHEPVGALVFGAMGDKPAPAMLDLLAPLSAHRVYVAPSGREPFAPEQLAARHPGEVASDVGQALARARQLAGRQLVVVAGSLYLVGAARGIVLGLPSDPPIAL